MPVAQELMAKVLARPSRLATAHTVARKRQVSVEAELVDHRHSHVGKDGALTFKNKAILDTGSLEYNYISYHLVYDLNLECMQLDRNIKISSINENTLVKRFVVIPQLELVYNNKK